MREKEILTSTHEETVEKGTDMEHDVGENSGMCDLPMGIDSWNVN